MFATLSAFLISCEISGRVRLPVRRLKLVVEYPQASDLPADRLEEPARREKNPRPCCQQQAPRRSLTQQERYVEQQAGLRRHRCRDFAPLM